MSFFAFKIRYLYLISICLHCISWNIPKYYQSFNLPVSDEERLDYVIVEINGDPQIVKRGEDVSFVRGDKLKIREAHLVGSTARIRRVNLVGFKGKDRDADDRLDIIDTSTQLTHSKWAANREGNVYSIIATSGKTLHGAIYLKRQEPRLDYIDVKVNGELRVWREDSTVSMKSTDSFKIERFQTNLSENKNIEFFVVPVEWEGSPKNEGKNYQVVFRNKDYVFARVPFEVKD